MLRGGRQGTEETGVGGNECKVQRKKSTSGSCGRQLCKTKGTEALGWSLRLVRKEVFFRSTETLVTSMQACTAHTSRRSLRTSPRPETQTGLMNRGWHPINCAHTVPAGSRAAPPP